MTALDLETIRENLEFGLEEFRMVTAPAQPDAAYAEACLLAWRRFRQLGVTVLLSDADGVAFRAHLARAAEIRRDFLRLTSGRPEAFAEYRRAGDLAGFADALVADRFDLAGEVAEACSGSWSPDYEYEDDFWYAKILHGLVVGGFAVDDGLRARLESLELAAEGESTGQVLVASALLESDGEGFAVALAARVAEFREWWARKGEGVIDDPDEYVTERHVFVEGLALKVIALRMGIPAAQDEPLMPREAWVGGG